MWSRRRRDGTVPGSSGTGGCWHQYPRRARLRQSASRRAAMKKRCVSVSRTSSRRSNRSNSSSSGSARPPPTAAPEPVRESRHRHLLRRSRRSSSRSRTLDQQVRDPGTQAGDRAGGCGREGQGDARGLAWAKTGSRSLRRTKPSGSGWAPCCRQMRASSSTSRRCLSPINSCMRRVRPILEGTFYEKYGFRIVPDFAGGQTVLYDAYIDANFDPAARMRVGKFKPPVGLERLESAADLAFVERAFPTNLVPTRDIGGQLSGDLLGGTLYYAVGVFNGAVDGGLSDGDNNDCKDFDARLFAHPFKNIEHRGAPGARRRLRLHHRQTIGHDQQRQSADLQDPRSAELLHLRDRRVRGRLAQNTMRRSSTTTTGRLGMMGEYYISAQEVRRVSQSAKREQLRLAALCQLGVDGRGRLVSRGNAESAVRLEQANVGCIRAGGARERPQRGRRRFRGIRLRPSLPIRPCRRARRWISASA